MTATLLADEEREVAATRAPSPPQYLIEAAPPKRPWWWAFDRTAVLALGIVAGFLLGLSFNAAGRAAMWAALFPDAARPAAPVPVQPLAAMEPQNPSAIDPRVIRRVAADGEIRVGVFGDSFGDGVWAGLYHQLPEKQHFQVFRFGKEATGFTRYKTLNLEERARAQVASQPIDVAVISFGANDVQSIFEEHHLQPLLGAGWRRIIGARVDRFVQVARSTGAAVYWVGLPVMRDTVMDGEVASIEAFFAARMRALGVPFVDTRSRSVDRAGGYTDYLPDPATGERTLMRKQDGVHMTMQGYDRLTAPLAARLRAYAVTVRRLAAASGHPTPALIEAMRVPAARANRG